jgi:hypothetical protein
MDGAATRVRAVFAASLAILAVFAGAPLSGQVLPVQSGQAPPASAQASPEPPKGTGILMGQVVDAGTRRGIPGATVVITSVGAAQVQTVLPTGEIIVTGGAAAPPAGPDDAPRQLLTDSSGRFMFRNLAAGRYSIRVTASPYLSGAYGANRAGAAAQTIELTRDDERRDGIVIRMWKGGSISGTIVDEVGEPVIGVGIRTIRRAVAGGRTRLLFLMSGTTDDRGAYRVTGLPPGEYFVGVISTSTTMPASTADALTQVMYSGTSMTTSDLYREVTSSGVSAISMVLGGGSGGYRVGDFIFQPSGTLGSRGTGSAPAPGADGRVLTYPSTFYPGVGVIAQATPITVASGEDRAQIDLQLKLLPSMRVSGTVMGPDGPMRNLGVRLLPAGADDFTSDTQVEAASSVTDANGAFTFLGVTPGSYTLKALRIPRPMPVSSRGVSSTMVEVTGPGGLMMGMSMGAGAASAPPPPPPLPTELTLWATTSVSVGDSDVGGLAVMLQPGVRLSGRIVFDGDAGKPTPEQVQQTFITLSPVTSTTSVASVAKRVESDGTFATNGFPPGKYLVTASAIPALAGKWKFKSATSGGRVVSDEGSIPERGRVGLVTPSLDRLGEISAR